MMILTKEYPTPEAAAARAKALLGGYTQAELETAFKLVEPRGNWKLPISAILPVETTAAELARIEFAVAFFTGGTATVTKMAHHGVLIQAPGYYASVGP